MTEELHKDRARSRGDMSMMAEGLKRSSETMDAAKSPIVQEVLAYLGDGRTVLDIGAGVGRFTSPLAKAGCQVVAIEPSAEMLLHLRETLEQHDVSGQVQVVESSWPLADALQAEVALAAFVIQFSSDFAGFAGAMERAATRRCVLAVHVDPIMGFMKPLWELFRPHEPAPHMPDFADIYPALIQAGIVADVRIFSESHGPRWTDPSEAIPMMAARLGIAEDPEALARLRAVLSERREEFMKPRPHRAAVISWSPRPE
ncbi:MAG: methyltransferase domain-containing protein [Firmicutes bacterium]|nr:methyltransferase domain-containing protein [Bacillota bacterium]